MFVVIDKRFAGRKVWLVGPLLCALASVAPAVSAQEPGSAPVAAPIVTTLPTPPMPVPPVVKPAPGPPEATVETPVVEGTAATTSAARTVPRSWFWRPPLRAELGEPADPWTVTLYGFAEADFIFDSTRSYDDAIGASLVARSDTYDGQVGRSQFSIRNSRLGLMFTSPTFAGVKGSAVIEADLFGSQPPVSERAFFTSPTFRLRQAYLQLLNDYVDVLAGQTYTVFGWQNYFFPCTVEFLGLPNQLFSRDTQLRLSHSFELTHDFSIDVAAAAVRPVQRDSAVPDAQAGVRFSVDTWRGIATPGSLGTLALPASIGVSGVVRQFKVNAFAPPPTQRSNNATGWGLAVDALVPIIPAANLDDRGNRLTFIGSFVTGTGIADLITAGGGAAFPTLPNPAQANPPPLYVANIDEGLVSFDTQGVVHTIDWWTFNVGLQYYVPPSGRLIISANYTQAHSGNMAELFPKGGAEIELLGRVADRSHYADINLFWDVTPNVRVGISGEYTKVIYLDHEAPHNLRGIAQALYAF